MCVVCVLWGGWSTCDRGIGVLETGGLRCVLLVRTSDAFKAKKKKNAGPRLDGCLRHLYFASHWCCVLFASFVHLSLSNYLFVICGDEGCWLLRVVLYYNGPRWRKYCSNCD